jgi:hypothetical protein
MSRWLSTIWSSLAVVVAGRTVARAAVVAAIGLPPAEKTAAVVQVRKAR